MDPFLTPTQFGFRKHQGTADALYCVRRAADIGESTKAPVFVVLLDWEKAFDRIYHCSLINSLRRLGVTGTLLQAIAALYHEPEFCIEVNGHVSTT
eukprot:5208691-Prorocentrum_lima.AAC.1